MSKGGFSLDFSKLKVHTILENVIPSLAEKGLWVAGNEVIIDAENEPPKVPHKEGHLKGTGQTQKINIGGDALAVKVSYGEPNIKKSLGQGGAPYAEYQHKGAREDGSHKVRHYTEPGSGPEFLSTKMQRHQTKYMAIVSETIKRGGK